MNHFDVLSRYRYQQIALNLEYIGQCQGKKTTEN